MNNFNFTTITELDLEVLSRLFERSYGYLDKKIYSNNISQMISLFQSYIDRDQGHCYIIYHEDSENYRSRLPVTLVAGIIEGTKICIEVTLVGPDHTGSRKWIYDPNFFVAAKNYYTSLGITQIDHKVIKDSSMGRHANKEFYKNNAVKLGAASDIQISGGEFGTRSQDGEYVLAVQVIPDKVNLVDQIGARIFQLPTGSLLDNNSSVTMTLEVCVPQDNTQVFIKLDNSTDESMPGITMNKHDTKQGWQTLSFEFNPSTEVYNQVCVYFNRNDHSVHHAYFISNFSHSLIDVELKNDIVYPRPGSRTNIMEVNKGNTEYEFEVQNMTWKI